MKHTIYEFEMLTDIRRGTYTVWTYYSDGSREERQVPKGPIFIPSEVDPVLAEIVRRRGRPKQIKALESF